MRPFGNFDERVYSKHFTMDKQALLDAAKELISNAQTAQAIKLTKDFLKKESRYKTLYREATRLSAFFTKTQRDQEKGILSFENASLSFNQANDSLLNLLEYIETDNLEPEALDKAPADWRGRYGLNKLLFLIGTPLIVISAAVVVLLLRREHPSLGEVNIQNNDLCAVHFKSSAENILVLPFFKPSGDEIQPEGLIVERLQDFSNQIKLTTDIGLCNNFKPQYLLDYSEADKMGRANQAKLIIWGRAEKGGGNTVIKIRFKYLGKSDTLHFSRLRWQGEKQIVTDKVLSVITSEGELTGDVEAILMLALGLVADQTGNAEAAIAALQAANLSDSTAVLMKNMMLADNFIKTEQPEKAIAALDTLLQTHPDYLLGRTNRAVLSLETGDYLGAVEDLTLALEKKPEDPDLLLIRGKALLRSEQLYPARADFEKFLQVSPQRSAEAAEELKETNRRITINERILQEIKNRPARELSRQDFTAAADASRQLGDTKVSRQFVAKGLQAQKDDPKLIAIQIENLLREKKTDEANQVLKDAVKRGVKKVEIEKHSPAVKHFSEQRVIRQ